MTTKYCNLCERNVNAARKIGVGTLLLCLLTGGVWLLAIPFYSQRCSICHGTALEDQPKKRGAA